MTALWIVKQLDVIAGCLAGIVLRSASTPSDFFFLWISEAALSNSVVMAVSASTHAMFDIQSF